jgi:hypothetical protein
MPAPDEVPFMGGNMDAVGVDTGQRRPTAPSRRCGRTRASAIGGESERGEQ